MSVLVTGGAGYLGSQLVLALRDEGENVVVLDNLSTGYEWAVPRGAELVIGDVGDRLLLNHIMRTRRVDAVLHLAGALVVVDSVADPLGYYLNHSIKTRELIAAAVANGVDHIVLSSSTAVYGHPAENPVPETAPLEPLTPYAVFKASAERMLAEAGASYGLKSVSLRTGHIAGADPSGRVGHAIVGATDLVKIVLEAALGRREYVPVFGTDYDTPDGTGIRDYVHVADAADAHLAALAYLRAGGDSLTVNCGYGQGHSVLEVIDAVQRIAGKVLDVRARARRADDIVSLVADPHRILKALAWQPRFSNLETILEHALAWEARAAMRAA
ncbi:UDP-glucose 4-epimerase GalE [Afifella sp. JA880]|uniref:UDP-glucose 4-epimerase GalE n=1 Tax=Afifella sp. JA880 TaxID=2975280 RepID=UPI0021BA5E95|nr:UDP-glucose 4-epimerase GalE [Afifella sp. JA880]MCT8268531.1 UDP-glucose 4-epimerase GalE [Afifella sp. JA880]